jgi:uncharacterized protein
MSRPRTQLSSAEARRLAISAQGLGRPHPECAKKSDITKTVARLGLLQIDSVNILIRAHYMPLFSRLGAYDVADLERAAYVGKRRQFFEYWAHEASLVPVALQPNFRWRMDDARDGVGTYTGLAKFGRENQRAIAEVLAEIRDRGPLAASQINGSTTATSKNSGWWGWSDAKRAVEWLFWSGHLTTARRDVAGFTRIYDLPERVLHADVVSAPTPDRATAQRALLRHASRALGLATAGDLRDYFRLPAADTPTRIAELVEAGGLIPVSVEGWQQQAYFDPEARIPRRVEATALLSPFDPLVWRRERAERLFNFHYRIEIYTPAAKRQFGYYCLPFVFGDRIAGRLDLKADRAARILRVEAAHVEANVDVGEATAAMAGELQRMARWLGLQGIKVARRGNAAAQLTRSCRIL